jgi:hypothetical protein
MTAHRWPLPGPLGDRARLIVLIGAAGAGKSSWAAAHYPAEQVLCLDQLRAVVSGDECDQDATGAAVELLLAAVHYRLATGPTAKQAGRALDGQLWDQYPAPLTPPTATPDLEVVSS